MICVGRIKKLWFVCVVRGEMVLCEVFVGVLVGCARYREGAASDDW